MMLLKDERGYNQESGKKEYQEIFCTFCYTKALVSLRYAFCANFLAI